MRGINTCGAVFGFPQAICETNLEWIASLFGYHNLIIHGAVITPKNTVQELRIGWRGKRWIRRKKIVDIQYRVGVIDKII